MTCDRFIRFGSSEWFEAPDCGEVFTAEHAENAEVFLGDHSL